MKLGEGDFCYFNLMSGKLFNFFGMGWGKSPTATPRPPTPNLEIKLENLISYFMASPTSEGGKMSEKGN